MGNANSATATPSTAADSSIPSAVNNTATIRTSTTTASEDHEECTACMDPGDDVTDTRDEAHGTTKKIPYAYMHSECPVNRRELGRASWAYLHTLAAFYPENPTQPHQEATADFMLNFARFYPCGYCADTSTQDMLRNPPRTASRQEFATWMCEIHNEVNDRLGKPMFDCSIEKVDERWRKGPPDGRCK
eukprot:m.152958 g.152958  ORF g.152958 m.152958 type:complete len:189 (+) comp17902_c0_seq2:278-844(+)